MLLLIIRHAAAEERCARRWPDDAQRPLTARGRRRFDGLLALVGRRLGGIDALLSSSLVRAWQTAAMIHERTGGPAPERFRALEFAGGHAIVESLRQLQRRRPELDCVTLVGHEPDLGELTALLVVGSDAAPVVRVRKGAIIALRMHADPSGWARGGAVIEWLAHPSLLE